MACRQNGDKPLYKPKMILVADAYMRHLNELTQK